MLKTNENLILKQLTCNFFSSHAQPGLLLELQHFPHNGDRIAGSWLGGEQQ
jgi:hypothetical protein